MDAFKLCLLCLFLTLLSSPNDAVSVKTCKEIKAEKPDAVSGNYIILSSSNVSIEVYCEMGLNGGGYTFLSPKALGQLTVVELSQMLTNSTTFLMRVRKTDGTQPYAVLRQLSEYSSIPLKLGISEHAGYNAPVNVNILRKPYLYFGFLSIKDASNNNIQGLVVNDVRVAFTNCDKNPNNHITLFPNFLESAPSSYYVPGPVCTNIFSNLLSNPSGRVMPPEYFVFAETHWGGCGCYVQTNQLGGIGILGINIGFQ